MYLAFLNVLVFADIRILHQLLPRLTHSFSSFQGVCCERLTFRLKFLCNFTRTSGLLNEKATIKVY